MKFYFPTQINQAANELINLCRTKNIKISTIESCTGGLLSACLTEIPGSSAVLDRGFVTYSNEAKINEVGVNDNSLNRFGAVSNIVAREMCSGALKRPGIDIAVSITGIAGPDGGTDSKPVGLVFIGLAKRKEPPTARQYIFEGDRQEIRTCALIEAMNLLKKTVNEIE